VKRHFEPALKRAGVKAVSFHSLRHTNASMRIAAGQNIKYIRTQLGHSSVKITLDIYGHLFNDVNFNRQQVKLLEKSLGMAEEPGEETPLLIASTSLT
jgi:integrase